MIVMKFGGTSVGNAERIQNVASLVKSRLKEKPVVVVSAVGGITDLLIQGGEAALQGTPPDSFLEKIKKIHLEILEKIQGDKQFLMDSLKELSELYRGIFSLKEFTARTRDRVTSFGERISARMVAECLRKQNVPARAYDSWEIGFITTGEFGQATLLPASEKEIHSKLAKLEEVPVITGFIGKDVNGHVTTLGRGGSDLSGSLIGAAIGANAIEIWTDVSGIMTADPRVVPEARTLPRVSFQEAAELSYFGARILHPKTIEPAMQKNIPVLVKNTFKPDDAGTTILPDTEKGSGLKAITAKKNITMLNLYSTGMFQARGFLARIFSTLEHQGISVDVVSTSEVSVSLTLDNTDGLDSAVAKLSEFAEVSVERERAIICLVGESLKDTPGFAGLIFATLGRAGVNVEMISQGASQINLTFVVKSSDAVTAVKTLHKEFFESKSTAASPLSKQK